jgi:glutaryl-CoA dehydrogenase
VGDVPRTDDLYLTDELLSAPEREVRDRVRRFCDEEVRPVINGYWERAEFPFPLLPKLAELGVCGGTIEGYGCPGLTTLGSGLVSMELARGDGSVSTFHGVQSGLTMNAIALLGSEEQKRRLLPPLASLEAIGAFALTEPGHGSDAVALETRVRNLGDGYVIDGEKRWIGNAVFADHTWCGRATPGTMWGPTSSRRAPRGSTPASSPARSPSAPPGRPT